MWGVPSTRRRYQYVSSARNWAARSVRNCSPPSASGTVAYSRISATAGYGSLGYPASRQAVTLDWTTS